MTSGVCGDVTVKASFDDPTFATSISHEYRDFLVTYEQIVAIPSITAYPTCYPVDHSLSTVDYTQGGSDPRIELNVTDPANPLLVIDSYSSGFEGTVTFDLVVRSTDIFNTEHRLSIDVTFTDKCGGNSLLDFYNSIPTGTSFSTTYI